MAKNLKINVKNAQLAEALKLSKVKKPAVKKKKAESSAKTEEKKAVPPEPAVEKTVPPTLVEPSVQEAAKEVPLPVEHKELKESKEKAPFVEENLSQTQPELQSKQPSPSSQPKEEYPYQRSEPRSYPDTRGYSESRPQSGGAPHYRKPGFNGSTGQPPYSSRTQGQGYSPRPHGQSYPPRQQGGYPPRQQYGQGGGYPPRQHSQGGYPPRHGQGGGYPPRQHSQGGYPPRQQYGQGGGGGYQPHPSGQGYRPDTRRPMPPKEAPRIEEPEQKKFSKHEENAPRKTPAKEFREHKPVKKQEDRSFDARDRQGLRDSSEDQRWRKRRPVQKMRPLQQEEIIRPKTLKVRLPITVKDLASEMKLKASQLIAKLFMKGVVLTLNDFLDDETTVQLLGQDFDCEISIDTTEEDRLRITDKTIKQEVQESSSETLMLRPPVVAFMGHVDHGKTSLIDAIRKSKLAAGEAGEITQHIGAFKCHTAVGDITILDTPGHEAFSAMRARGADVTDIVVLVVAGDEGVRAQTIEAIEQAQAANVPILVVLNKSDKPNFNPENVYRQLADHNLLPESWGGQTITVNCSAITGAGIKELLEMLALQAEVLELKANPHTRARGTVIESQMHKGLGAVATVLVQNGTLRLGDALVFTQQFARVKTMHDEHGKELTHAGPSTPVKITGLSDLPQAGSEFIVVKSEKEAMEIAEKRLEGQRHALLHLAKSGAEAFLAEKANGIKKKILNLILRADVQGSVEALKTSLLKIQSKKIELNIISSAVGEISESDIQLAYASKALIVGFHTQIESHSESLIKSLKVTVKLHDVIYHAVDDVRAIMLSMLDKIPQETEIGAAEVKATFKASQLGIIAGCMVTDGIIKRSSHVRQVRDKQVIWKGSISSLKKVKEDVREVSKGHECGIVLQNNNEIKVGDILQAFEITYLEQDL